MGQVCISVNRIYVAEEIADQFTAKLLEHTERLRIGNGLDPDVDLGPMFSEAQREKTREHVADALAKGASLLCGGREPEGRAFEKGFFYLPTVLGNVDHSMRIMREETFGPVAPIMRFKTLEEAIALANDTEFGLAAYLFTRDLKAAVFASERLEAGGIGVNVNNVVDIQAPFGGWKQSGLGRELGHYGLEAYLETKHISWDLRCETSRAFFCCRHFFCAISRSISRLYLSGCNAIYLVFQDELLGDAEILLENACWNCNLVCVAGVHYFGRPVSAQCLRLSISCHRVF